MNKGGRPVKYTEKELLEILLKYVEQHPDQMIRMCELEKETGIKRHVWTYNMQNEIDKFNKKVQDIKAAKNGIDLPSVEQILTSCKGNEKKLAIQLQTLIDMVQELSKYMDAERAVKYLKKDYENQLTEKDNIIKQKDKKIEALYTEINKLIIDSDNPNKRKEQGIKNNIIEFSPENLENFKKRAKNLLL